jgi:hypothetical protein
MESSRDWFRGTSVAARRHSIATTFGRAQSCAILSRQPTGGSMRDVGRVRRSEYRGLSCGISVCRDGKAAIRGLTRPLGNPPIATLHPVKPPLTRSLPATRARGGDSPLPHPFKPHSFKTRQPHHKDREAGSPSLNRDDATGATTRRPVRFRNYRFGFGAETPKPRPAGAPSITDGAPRTMPLPTTIGPVTARWCLSG